MSVFIFSISLLVLHCYTCSWIFVLFTDPPKSSGDLCRHTEIYLPIIQHQLPTGWIRWLLAAPDWCLIRVSSKSLVIGVNLQNNNNVSIHTSPTACHCWEQCPNPRALPFILSRGVTDSWIHEFNLSESIQDNYLDKDQLKVFMTKLNRAAPLYRAQNKPSTVRQLAFSNENICQAHSGKNRQRAETLELCTSLAEAV